jgi:hypothetical protein
MKAGIPHEPAIVQFLTLLANAGLPAFADPNYDDNLLGESMKITSILISSAILAAGITATPVAQAVTKSRSSLAAGGPACQLSLPTTDTTVRARASGFRNEGTTSAVVICEFLAPDGDMTGAIMYVTPIDGVGRSVTCSGVNGYNLGPGYSTIQYSTKSMLSNAVSGVAGVFQWTGADFGGVDGDELTGIFSVTCTLPAKTQINMIATSYSEDVGS